MSWEERIPDLNGRKTPTSCFSSVPTGKNTRSTVASTTSDGVLLS